MIIFGMVITTVGFFTAILNVFGGILLGVISFFFLDQYVDGALALYAVVSVIYIFVLVNNFVLIKRLANGEYVRSLITGQIIRNYTRDGL